MTKEKAIAIYWKSNRWGYTIIVMGEDDILEQYEATNNPLDSQGPVVIEGVSLATLRKWAISTAYELAEEYGMPPVFEDTEAEFIHWMEGEA